MTRRRDRRPPRPPLDQPPPAREPWGSPRKRDYLYQEIYRRLAALQAEREYAQQIAPGFAAGGYARRVDEIKD
ncbi:hypothetical protein BH10PSE4_BH10PSE4_04860 [soil metagenome]